MSDMRTKSRIQRDNVSIILVCFNHSVTFVVRSPISTATPELAPAQPSGVLELADASRAGCGHCARAKPPEILRTNQRRVGHGERKTPSRRTFEQHPRVFPSWACFPSSEGLLGLRSHSSNLVGRPRCDVSVRQDITPQLRWRARALSETTCAQVHYCGGGRICSLHNICKCSTTTTKYVRARMSQHFQCGRCDREYGSGAE